MLVPLNLLYVEHLPKIMTLILEEHRLLWMLSKKNVGSPARQFMKRIFSIYNYFHMEDHMISSS